VPDLGFLGPVPLRDDNRERAAVESGVGGEWGGELLARRLPLSFEGLEAAGGLAEELRDLCGLLLCRALPGCLPPISWGGLRAPRG
jgi:hypothetical protein